MPTQLNKKVTRRSNELKRDRSKMRRIIVSIHPAGFVGLRLEKCRTEETISISALYDIAVKSRVFKERMEKAKAKGGKFLVRRGRI